MAGLVCFICGQAADDGWVYGFQPAPTSHKLALCKTHNIPSNQEDAIRAWGAWLEKAILQNEQATKNSLKVHHYDVTVFYTSGGVNHFACISCQPTSHGTLRLQELDGTCRYIPLAQVKNYSVNLVGE